MSEEMICDNISVNNEGHLVFANQDTVSLAKEYGTPLYLLDENKIQEKCRIYTTAMHKYFNESSMPLYAGKALCFKKIYSIIGREGMGADVVSSGEIHTVASAGFDMSKTFFHGNGKTDQDITYAMEHQVGYFICDNIDELKAVDEEARDRCIMQKVLLRITPGIDPHTHEKINTGRVDSKFGAAIETDQAEELFAAALAMKNIVIEGFHCHIGSQIFEFKPFGDAAEIMLKFIADMQQKYHYEIKSLNLGGGMGVRYVKEDPIIDYDANIKRISEIIKERCTVLNIKVPTIYMEPGRSIVADAGMTLYTVQSVKEIKGFKNYAAIDGGMTDNPRYTLYQSLYTVLLANRMNDDKDFACSIAGRCCKSGDMIQENVSIPHPHRGDLVAVLTTGAYNYSMASNYNRVPRPALVILKGGTSSIGIQRESYEDLTRNDL